MTIDWLFKNAWSLRPEERPPGECIGSMVTDENAYFFYGPDEEGNYRYKSATDFYIADKKKKKRKEDNLINIYIDSNFKGTKGRINYGFFLEWVRDGAVMNEPKKDHSNMVFGEVEDTRNRAFLKATIEAIGRISEQWMRKDPQPVHIYANCEYLVTSMLKHLPEQWMLHGWIKGDGKEVKNRDLWLELKEMIEKKHITDIEWTDGSHKLSEKIVRGIERKWERPISERA